MAGTRFVSVVLAMLLAAAMLPAAGLQVAYADEPVERPATSGGDVALESTNGAAAAPRVPVAETREDGMLAADGLMYTVADGGLALVGLDGEAPGGALAVPAAVMLDGKETPVVAIDFADGQVAGEVVVLSLPQGIKEINTATLASAFPALLSVEVASGSSTLPVASGAASLRATYSTSGGMLFRPTTVTLQVDDGSIEAIECKELLWAPPALVSARIPVECRAIAEGAFADARGLKTVVAFGTMERISDGAFSADQMEASKVVVPASSPAVTDAERVSASMALMGDAGQKERRSAWHEAGWRTDDIVMGKPYGSLTETVAVTDEGKIERDELQLVFYPGAHENAMDLKKPNADGVVEQAESGLAFTVKSDMTTIVTWQGDKTATPSRIEIPTSVIIDGVTYPVTEIAPNAFEGASFLKSIAIPETVTMMGEDAFADCPNLAGPVLPAALAEIGDDTAVSPLSLDEGREQRGFAAGNDGNSSPMPDSSSMAGARSAEEVESALADIAPFSSNFFRNVIQFRPQIGSRFTVVKSSNLDVHLSDGDLTIDLQNIPESAQQTGIQWYYHSFSPTTVVISASDPTHQTGYASIELECPADWMVMNIGSDLQSLGDGLVFAHERAIISLAHKSALTGFPILTTASLSGSGSAETAARSDHTHSNYITKAVSELDNFYEKAAFNTIGYDGLDEADYAGALPTFYVNDASKLPKVPEPRREGHEFLGWTWAGQETPTKDPSAAFSGGGAVTLTAKWGEAEPETPEAKHFFTSDSPLRHDDASATQTHVIKVRLSNSPGTLASVSFEGDDRTGLLRDTSGVRLFVGASEDALSSGTELSWGGATASGWECELTRFADSSYGVYVGVSIPTSAIDESAIPVSYADGSYVASLVKMNYAFA